MAFLIQDLLSIITKAVLEKSESLKRCLESGISMR